MLGESIVAIVECVATVLARTRARMKVCLCRPDALGSAYTGTGCRIVGKYECRSRNYTDCSSSSAACLLLLFSRSLRATQPAVPRVARRAHLPPWRCYDPVELPSIPSECPALSRTAVVVAGSVRRSPEMSGGKTMSSVLVAATRGPVSRNSIQMARIEFEPVLLQCSNDHPQQHCGCCCCCFLTTVCRMAMQQQ